MTTEQRDPADVLRAMGWASERGKSNNAPATFWTVTDENDYECDVVVSRGAVNFGDAFYSFTGDELRAFAALSEAAP